MRDPHELTIRLQALDGRWETVGRDRYRGIQPEHFTATANRWGSDTCSFELRRDPSAIDPDLGAFTPCEVEIAGLLCWSGQVKETPTRDGDDAVITVHGKGWQYHLDDDVLDRYYVHTRLSDYKDMRSFPNAVLGSTRLYAAGQVSNDNGTIHLALPNGVTCVIGNYVGVVLDLGEGKTWKRAVLEYETSNNSSAALVYVRGASTPDETSWTANDAVSGVALTTLGASGTTAGTITTASRYVHVFLYANFNSVPNADIWIKIKALRIFADTAYESGNQSTLTADQIVEDTLDQATLLLSSDRSEIELGTFDIPDFAPQDARSAREMITAANAYENYETKVDVDRRMLFRPRASAPIYEIGEWPGADFTDGTANSGDEIYNRDLVQGTGPDGAPLSATRHSAALPGVTPRFQRDVLTPQPTNPSFASNTTGWAATGDDSISRDTGVFDTSPASLLITQVGVAATVQMQSWTEEFTPGALYRLTLRLRAAGGWAGVVLTEIDSQAESFVPTTSFGTFTLDWVAQSPTPLLDLVLQGTAGAVMYVDSVEVQRAVVNIVDRRSFIRTKILPVRCALVDASSERLGDLYLEAHQTTPFKGDFRVVGQGGVRRVIGGQSVHPAWLLRDTGQFVRCSHRIDPDTGGWGRDGEIDTVTYNHDEIAADGSLDENRAGFETLVEQLAVVVGS